MWLVHSWYQANFTAQLKKETVIHTMFMLHELYFAFKVFLTEYAGPLVLYLVFYLRPAIIYGSKAAGEPKAPVVE